MRRFRGLRDPRNPMAAAPEVLRNIVGATDINEEFVGGLENVLALFICDENRDPDPPRNPVRLMLATALNYWPTGIPDELTAVCPRPVLVESNWMTRAECLAKSRLIALSERPEAANRESIRAFQAFAEYALDMQPAPGRNYFSRRLRPLWLSEARQIDVYEVASVSGTPAISWQDFGYGIQRLAEQIKEHDLDIDLVIGVNEAGLSMSAMLAPVWRSRPALGLLRTRGAGPGQHEPILSASMLPAAAASAEAVLLCDFEAKSGNAPSVATGYVRRNVPEAKRIYLAVTGAQLARKPDAVPGDGSLRIDDLACRDQLRLAELDDIFVAAVMTGGIDPPTRSR